PARTESCADFASAQRGATPDVSPAGAHAGKERGQSKVETKELKRAPYIVRPSTAVLSRGFDPSFSVGSARPAVFRSSTYVFTSPEAAERAFDIMGGRAGLKEGEEIRLVYSRF